MNPNKYNDLLMKVARDNPPVGYLNQAQNEYEKLFETLEAERARITELEGEVRKLRDEISRKVI